MWNAGEGTEHAERIAARRVGEPDVLAPVAAGIRALDRLAQETAGTWSLGVWLPDASTGEAAATLLVQTVAPDGPHRMTPDQLLAWTDRRPRIPGHKVLDVAAEPGEVDAGPVVIQVLTSVPRRSGRITAQVSWFVLPPGTEEMVLCRFDADHPALVDALIPQTAYVADSLVVHLEPQAAQ